MRAIYSYKFSMIIVQRNKFKLLSPVILYMHFDIQIFGFRLSDQRSVRKHTVTTALHVLHLRASSTVNS